MRTIGVVTRRHAWHGPAFVILVLAITLLTWDVYAQQPYQYGGGWSNGRWVGGSGGNWSNGQWYGGGYGGGWRNGQYVGAAPPGNSYTPYRPMLKGQAGCHKSKARNGRRHWDCP